MSQDFIHEMRQQGLNPPELIDHSKFNRFGKNKNEWAILFPDGDGGVFGDWASGLRGVWQSKKYDRQHFDSAEFKRKKKEAVEKASKERESEYLRVGDKADALWKSLPPATNDHPYLQRKMIPSFHGVKQYGDKLFIPVHTVQGDRMQSYQTIDPEGKKMFATGGRITAGCFMLGLIRKGSPVYICEGFATGASLIEVGANFVVIAFNAGNLLAVAIEVKRLLPDFEIVIASDDDWKSTPNVGQIKATEASKAIQAKMITPNFGDTRLDHETDYNDLWIRRKDGKRV